MRKSFAVLLFPFLCSCFSFSATVIEENFTYPDGDVAGLNGGTGWDAAEGGWLAGNAAGTRRFIVDGNQALYQGGGSGTQTEQNRSFAAPLTSSEAAPIELRFTLLRPEGQSGRGIGIYLTNAGANQLFIGKKINGNVGLHSAINGTSYPTFANSGASEPILATISYDGTDTSIVLSDSNETLAAHIIAGTFSFDGISLAGYNGATVSNGIDSISVNVGGNPDPWLTVDEVPFTAGNATEALYFEISNAGASQDLVVTGATPGGTDASNIVVDTAFPLTIPAGSTDYIDFTFTPNGTYQTTYAATLAIASTDAASPKTVNLNITNNPDPWIGASDLNLVNNGAPASYALPVGNLGFNKDLTITAATPSGLDAGTVVIDTAFPLVIAPGSDDVIDFTFTPNLGALTYSLELTIDSDDPATPAKLVTVVIDAQDPVIAVSGTTLDFGLLPHSPGPQVLSVTVSNNGGTQDLTIEDTTGITGDAEFTVTSPALPVTIGPGATTDIEVTFTPGTASGRFSGTLAVVSNDFNFALPEVVLTGFVDPAGTIVSRFDFDPSSATGSIVDLDGSAMSAWKTGDLIDVATGSGALGLPNQGGSNRNIVSGISGNYLRLSSNRESDAQTPVLGGGNDESTWTTFTVTPDSGGGSLDFSGGAAVVDTYAFTAIGGNTAADWTLYYSTDGGTTWIPLGPSPGAATSDGLSSPLGLSWDLSVIGVSTTPVDFILDPISTGATNGTDGQRGVGFDNLVLSVGSVTPGIHSFATWAADNGIANDPNGDTDHDGIEELVEYALGLNPNVPDGSPAVLTGNELSFAKGAEAVANGDAAYAIETSSDLGQGDPWTPVSDDDLNANDDTAISYTLPGGAGKIFARLLVVERIIRN